jgi:hypothetical protein
MKYKQLFFFVLLLSAGVPVFAQIKWVSVFPGVWKGVIGKPEAYDLLKASGAKPDITALSKIPSASFPIAQTEISGFIADGKTALRFPLEREEQLYGFCLNFQTVHQRGKILQLHVDHYGTKPSKYMLYDDDGETFNYEKGEYSWREIKIEKNNQGTLIGTISDAVGGKPNTVGKVTWRFMTK